MVPPHAVDTKNPAAVAQAVREAFAGISAQSSLPLIDRLFVDVTAMFEGRYPGYQAIDMSYHDYEHTLQATICLIHILQGRHRLGDWPIMASRDWELALIAVLLHDSGYLKHTDDLQGTGAKYTLVHERRSCEFARVYMPQLGVSPAEIEDVCSGIMCTGPRSKLSQVAFRREQARMIASSLVTADYLAQMSSSDYVDELPSLFREFQEAFDFERVPVEKRPYSGLRELLEKTPGFWENYVRPMLDFEAGSVYRYLGTAGQTNPYLEAVAANMAEVNRRLKSGLAYT